jgi:osmotically-inducible protein OsmY
MPSDSPRFLEYSESMPLKKLLLVLVFAFCSLRAQGTPADDQLYDKVRMKLAADRDVNGGAIEVIVKNGVVTLQGKVHKDKQKQRAEHVAKKVKGVTSVVNNLKVEFP